MARKMTRKDAMRVQVLYADERVDAFGDVVMEEARDDDAEDDGGQSHGLADKSAPEGGDRDQCDERNDGEIEPIHTVSEPRHTGVTLALAGLENSGGATLRG